MSLLSNIFGAIFGRKTAPAPTPTPSPSQGGATPGAPAPVGGTAPVAAPAATVPPAAAAEPVDVEKVMAELAAKNPEKLDWKKSIVDLMKLVGMDSSLANRKELADELGYKGDKSDSAAMNIWLHKEVLKRIAGNGGKVPANLLD